MTTDSTPSLDEGALIEGKWEILSHIATGGKGEVYLARQINLDRKVAVKIISSAFLNSLEDNAEEIDAELDRFAREVRIMAKMRHPNVLQVYDYGVVNQDGNNLHYIVMEYVPGPTLKITMYKQGFGDDENAIRHWLSKYYLPVLGGVEAVNAQNIIHRDLKPSNVLLDGDTPKIADFGLAGGAVSDDITRSYHILGTMPYMPEEQFMDLATTDVRADVYALGKILYEAVVGKLTKENSPPFKTVGLDRPQTPFMKDLDRIIRRATAGDRNDRTPTVSSLREAVLCLLDKECKLNGQAGSNTSLYFRPTLWVFLSGLLLALLIAGLLYHYRGMPSSSPPKLGNQDIIDKTEKYDEDKELQAGRHMRNTEGRLKPAFTGLDGATMRLVQTSDFTFYMEETQVTNHQFVEFIRSVPSVTVKGDVAYNGNVPWLYLGEVKPGYEPIRFMNNQFTLVPQTALNPVVRVTPQGAEAYAGHYGRSLPTMNQWLEAKRLGETRQGEQSSLPATEKNQTESETKTVSPDQPVSQESELNSKSLILFPVVEAEANSLGIRGLGTNVNEWVVENLSEKKVKFHVHGGLGSDNYQAYLERNSWEAFADVGFRTVIAVKKEEGL